MSDANRTSLSLAREASYNLCSPIIPTDGASSAAIPVFAMRFTKSTLKHQKQTVESEEIRSDRMISDIIQVGYQHVGATSHELAAQDYDELLAAALFQDEVLCASIAVDVSGQTITVHSGGSAAGFRHLKGAKYLRIANAVTSGNNGVKAVVSVTDTVITFATGSLSGSDSNDTIDIYAYFTAASVDVTASLVGQVLTASVGTYSAAVQGARYVRLAGFSNTGNNGIKKVASCTSTVLTLATGQMTGGNEAGVAVNAVARYIRTGTTLLSYVIQETFLDVASGTQNMVYTGSAIDSLDLKLEAKQRALLDFNFMGYRGQQRTGPINNAAALAASTNSIVNTTSNVGSVLVNGTATTNPVKSLSLKIDNNLRQRPAIGEPSTLQFGLGESKITGSLSAYFVDNTTLLLFLNHTASSLEYATTDASGNVINVYMPSIHYPEGSPEITGINSDVMLDLTFEAKMDTTKLYQLQIDLLLA